MKNVVYLVVLKPSSNRTAEESLGVQYLASVLESAGYTAKIRDAWIDNTITEQSILDEILKNKSEVLFVGTSSYMLNNLKTCDLIEALYKNNINVVSGGFGPTFEPRLFLEKGADFVMVGEGEATILQAAKYFEGRLKKEQICGINYLSEGKIIATPKHTAIKNLDELPFPKRPYLDIVKKRHSTINVLTSRGCMGACSFCSISAFLCKQNSARWRARSVPNIIAELKELKAKGATTIKFVDDSFIENERDDNWCKNFKDQILKNNLKLNFRASIRADKVTPKNMKYLKEAGFFSFSCGIENGSYTALKRMGKLASLEDNKRALAIFKDNNIYVQAGFILFDDQTTIKELEENYEFLKDNLWLVSKGIFSEMFAAAGTAFTKKAKLESKDKYFANNLYKVKDEKARMVYDAMKKWQANHAKTYDMVIDPISAPKDIPVENMEKYYKLMLVMKQIDLEFMGAILSAVNSEKNWQEVYDEFFAKYTDVFVDINKTALEYNQQEGLNYDAEENGFLTASK